MFYKKILITGIVSCILLSLTGCLTFYNIVTKDTPNTLAQYLKLRKNYWYVLDKEDYPVLFYNDFQDYTLIIKARYDLETNMVYKRKSLDQCFSLEDKSIKLPPECKGLYTHFIYEGKKALFFDLDAFCYEHCVFYEFIINDGKRGYIYSKLSKSFSRYIWEFNILYGIQYYQILQAEPDFHLLDLSSVKKK
ncbi:MAG: hypothetical protein A2017_01230 [Lentisphaerae bacterium GWF2_44_16]|nr:MAG: hypothetical protein A2017_01230 [Lentisphaerae bacterium GWF2_44_16]